MGDINCCITRSTWGPKPHVRRNHGVDKGILMWLVQTASVVLVSHVIQHRPAKNRILHLLFIADRRRAVWHRSFNDFVWQLQDLNVGLRSF